MTIMGRHVALPAGAGRVYAARGTAAAANWWEVSGKTCVAAYQAKGAASLAASYVNLANSGTYDAAPGTAPDWAAGTGWTFDATNSEYLTTGVTPGQTWSWLVRYADVTNSAAGPQVFGSGIATNDVPYFGVRLSDAFGPGIRICHGEQFESAGNYLSGVAGAAATNVFWNGSDIGNVAWRDEGVEQAVIIGAFLINAPVWFLSGVVIALALYSDTLTAGEMGTVSTAMAAL